MPEGFARGLGDATAFFIITASLASYSIQVRVRQRTDHGCFVAACRKFDAIEIPEPVQCELAIRLFGGQAILLSNRRGQIANAAANDQQVVVADIVHAEQTNTDGSCLILEQLEC